MTSKEIIEKYPKVFGTPPYDPMKSLMCFGFDCGEGWYPIIEDLAEKINEIVERDNLEDFCVVQVKEKFGSLTIYCRAETDEIHSLINEAERKSTSTCEICGAPGSMITKGWISVLCDDCRSRLN